MSTSMIRPALTMDEVHRLAPSVFATEPKATLSDRYSFIPTVRVVQALMSEGWMPVQASEVRVRDFDRQGLQKHLIRFQQSRDIDGLRINGGTVVELVLTNSHDGTNVFVLHAGIFRLVCSNGMIVADSTFGSMRVKHIGYDDKDVIEGSYRLIEDVPKISEKVDDFKAIELTRNEQLIYAGAAIKAKYEDERPPIEAGQLIVPKRNEDTGNSLWTTYNKVQEKLTKGGVRGFAETGRRVRTRPITGIDSDVKVNKALWFLTEEMAKLKKAA